MLAELRSEEICTSDIQYQWDQTGENTIKRSRLTRASKLIARLWWMFVCLICAITFIYLAGLWLYFW